MKQRTDERIIEVASRAAELGRWQDVTGWLKILAWRIERGHP